MILILDLDDTIFETNSIDMSLFDPAKEIIESYTLKEFGETKTGIIVEEIKKMPFDIVVKNYNLPDYIVDQFYKMIERLSYELEIEVYEDYRSLQQLDCLKYLVTTGMTNLQKAKIKALNISSDFVEIFIDDPSQKDRLFKRGIFENIINKSNDKEIWVIGDNPESELKSGKELGLKTVQRIKGNYKKSKYSDFAIQTFNDLEKIIKSGTQQ